MKTVDVKMSAGTRKGSGVLALSGNLSLDCSEEIARSFREAAEQYTDIEVAASSVASIDLGFLQLLHALEAEQARKGNEFVVHLELEEDQTQLLRDTGFSRWVGTPARHAK